MPPLEPKLKAFWRTSLIPVEPEPTPKKTKPSAKATASSTNTHFACVAQPLEEQLLLPLRRLLLACGGRGYGCGASILRRAALAVLRTSCHCVLVLRFGSGSGRRRSFRALVPASRRRRLPPRDPPPDGRGFPRATRPPGRRACRASGYPPRRRVRRARAASSVASAQRVLGQQRVRAPLAGARGVDRGPHLLEDVERGRRGRRVGSEADDAPRPRAGPRAARCRSRAARSSAGSGRPGRRRSASSAISACVDLDAVRAEQVRARARARASRRRACPVGGDEDARDRRQRAGRRARATRSRSRSRRGACRRGCRATRHQRYTSSEHEYGACGETPIRDERALLDAARASPSNCAPRLRRVARRTPRGRRSRAGRARRRRSPRRPRSCSRRWS